MRRFLASSAALLVVFLYSPVHAGGGPECWRRGGPPALAAMMAEHADAIRRCREGNPVENWAKLSTDLDAVAAQRDAWASGLYWYTDLDEAKAAARREGKPILSLRLLGRLDQELSCANSRYFRTTLYPVADVSSRMRERFVLHWSSERPVPVVTVDFGDGRMMRRTVTGNSAHYMMTSDGEVVDVLPGLYGAKPFAAWLDDAGAFAGRITTMTPSDRAPAIRTYHQQKRADLDARWAADQRAVGATPKSEGGTTSLLERQLNQNADGKAAGAVPARRAAGISISKRAGEFPVVALLSVADPSAADESLWSAIANLHLPDVKLDADAVAVMRSKRPAGAVDRVLPALQRTIAQDTVRNQYTLHRTIHAWLASGGEPTTSFEKLNERIYAQLFLTPRSDPWLGLAPANAWSGLDDDGLSAVATR